MVTTQLDYITMTGNRFLTFLKLNSNNFYSWKNNMDTVLYGLNQMVMIQGTLLRPRLLKLEELVGAEFTAMVAWDLHAGRAYMELALHIGDEWRLLNIYCSTITHLMVTCSSLFQAPPESLSYSS